MERMNGPAAGTVDAARVQLRELIIEGLASGTGSTLDDAYFDRLRSRVHGHPDECPAHPSEAASTDAGQAAGAPIAATACSGASLRTT